MGKFVFSTNGEMDPIKVEFADGVKELPAHIMRAIDVTQFQDEANLEALKKVTWAAFLKTIEKKINQSSLDSAFGRERMLEVNRKQVRGL